MEAEGRGKFADDTWMEAEVVVGHGSSLDVNTLCRGAGKCRPHFDQESIR